MSDNDMDYDAIDKLLWGFGGQLTCESQGDVLTAFCQLRARVAELESERADLRSERDRAYTQSADADARIAELEAAQRWQPMESAPMDGTRILLDEGGAAVVGWYETGPSMGAFGEPLNDWTDGMETAGGYDCGYRLIAPKGWARLPEPKPEQ